MDNTQTGYSAKTTSDMFGFGTYVEEKGIRKGIAQGERLVAKYTIKTVESAMKNFGLDLQSACKGLGTSIEEYENAKKLVTLS